MSISVQHLTKIYGEQRAVDDISFEVPAGQIVGFLGPNGAGKSTTMKILTCFIPPSAGEAKVCGFDGMKDPIEVKKEWDICRNTIRSIPTCTCRNTWSSLPACRA